MKSHTSTVQTAGFATTLPSSNSAFSESAKDLTIESSIDAIAYQVANRRYGFVIGNVHMLVPSGLFCELLVDIDISPLPNSPEHVVGLSNHRGNIVPIYTLAPLLGLAAQKLKYAYLIGTASDGAALIINEKPFSIDMSEASKPDSAEKIPSFLQGCVENSYQLGETTWHALNPDALFRKLATPK